MHDLLRSLSFSNLRQNSIVMPNNSSVVFIHANFEMVRNQKTPPGNTGLVYSNPRISVSITSVGNDNIMQNNRIVYKWRRERD